MSVAWHPDRWWNWCVTEDKKKGTRNLLHLVLLRVIAETGYALAQCAETAPPSALRPQGDEPTRPQAISCPHVMLVEGLKFTNKKCLLSCHLLLMQRCSNMSLIMQLKKCTMKQCKGFLGCLNMSLISIRCKNVH